MASRTAAAWWASNLMFHPYALTQVIRMKPLDGNQGPPLCLWSHEFYETDPNRGFVRGYSYQFSRGIGAITEAIASSAAGRLPWSAAPPRGSDFQRQSARKPERCQRSTVSGLTIFSASRTLGAIAYIRAKTTRSMLEKARRPGDLQRSTIQLVAEREEFGFERRRGTGTAQRKRTTSACRSIIARNHQPISRRPRAWVNLSDLVPL